VVRTKKEVGWWGERKNLRGEANIMNGGGGGMINIDLRGRYVLEPTEKKQKKEGYWGGTAKNAVISSRANKKTWWQQIQLHVSKVGKMRLTKSQIKLWEGRRKLRRRQEGGGSRKGSRNGT